MQRAPRGTGAEVKQAFGNRHIAVFIGARQDLAEISDFHAGPVYGVDANGNPINNPYQPHIRAMIPW